MTASPQPPPEAALIAERRQDVIPPLSRRQAALRAGISVTLWAKIEHGYEQPAAGLKVPFRGSASAVAKMARVVGITPPQLEASGRKDAARILASLAPVTGSRPDPLTELRKTMRRAQELMDELERGKDKGA